MTIETNRLEIIPLKTEQLKKLIFNIDELEKELNFKYQAEPLVGFFLEIVKGQYEICKTDSDNYIWHSFFLLIRKTDRLCVGMADFKDIPNEKGEVEIGYGLTKAFEKRGYMTEAVKALCSFALKEDGVFHVIAETEKDGFSSCRILEKCGFQKYIDSDTLWWKL